MEFTYEAYIELISLLKRNDYIFSKYTNFNKISEPVILRHDVDISLEKALDMAKLEYQKGVSSTYFVLLSTNFYNIFSKESNEILFEIMDLGHEIGLHFDEKRYEIKDEEDLEKYIQYEKDVLERAFNKEINVVSMHRPSKWILENDIQFKSIINTYSTEFLHHFKYVSDSRMHWREDIISVIKSNDYDKLHILTHPFWYANERQDINEKLMEFIGNGRKQRYKDLSLNIRDLKLLINKKGFY